MKSLTIRLPDSLAKRIQTEARRLERTPPQRVLDVLEQSIAPARSLAPGHFEAGLRKLESYLKRVPAIRWLGRSKASDALWWCKFGLDLDDKLAWQVVQELGYVLNELSIEERLPVVFKPTSPPPYLNGGPREFLSWVIEAQIPFLDAGYVAGTLQGRLPRPVQKRSAWRT